MQKKEKKKEKNLPDPSSSEKFLPIVGSHMVGMLQIVRKCGGG
jgi:hypothetical protein